MTADTQQTAGPFGKLLLAPIDGGWRIKLSADGRHYIDLLEQLFSWRIVTTPVLMPSVWDRGWCYFGFNQPGEPEGTPKRTKESAFRAALWAAAVWDGDDATAPAGHNKQVGDAGYYD